MTGPPTPTTEPSDLRCAVASRRREDTLIGTAAPADRYFLVEQPGPWGRDAFRQSRLDPDVGAAVQQRVMADGGRPLLIRRPGSRGSADAGPRRWFHVEAADPRPSLRTGVFTAAADLLEIAGDTTAGEPVDEPLWLVCTHGRHDRCCAQDGRPVVAALARRRPASTWECSHIGGDRFAANVLLLPRGDYHGHVTAADVDDLLAADARQGVVARLLRGRSVHLPAAQAAQHLARERLGLTGRDDLAPVTQDPLGDGRWRVHLAGPHGALRAVVGSGRGESVGLLTCAATHLAHPPRWTLESLEPADAAAAGTGSV